MPAFWNRLSVNIKDEIREPEERILVTVDFNPVAFEWGMTQSNFRATQILEINAKTGFIVLNIGSAPTF